MKAGSILCAVVNDDNATRVVATGRELAAAAGCPVRYGHVADVELSAGATVIPGGGGVGWAPFPEGGYERARERAVERGKRMLAGFGLPEAEMMLTVGSAGSGLCELAADARAEAIVVGGRPRAPLTAAAVGSVTRWLTVNGDRPVVFARERPAIRLSGGPVVCGVEPWHSEWHRPVAAAVRMATLLDRGVLLVSVGDAGDLEETGARLDELAAEHCAGVETEVLVETGSEPERLAAAADDRDAPLIVVGSRGHGALRSALTGSVSLEVAGAASHPVVVVPPRWTPPGAAGAATSPQSSTASR